MLNFAEVVSTIRTGDICLCRLWYIANEILWWISVSMRLSVLFMTFIEEYYCICCTFIQIYYFRKMQVWFKNFPLIESLCLYLLFSNVIDNFNVCSESNQSLSCGLGSIICPSSLGTKIQPTHALVRFDDLLWGDKTRSRRERVMNCPIPPAYCVFGLPVCSGANELGQKGTG